MTAMPAAKRATLTSALSASPTGRCGCTTAEAALNGTAIDAASIAAAAEAARRALDPPDDIHAGGAYRRVLAGVMLEQALNAALIA